MTKSLEEFGSFKDTRNGKVRYRHECKVCRGRRENERTKANRERANENNRRYYNKPDVKEQRNEYAKKRHAKKLLEDPQFRLRANIGTQIRHALKDYKKDKSKMLVGCDIPQLKEWLQYQFVDDMNWDNNKEWHVDHIIPLAFFDLTKREEQLLACSWTNLRPLWAKENRDKRDKILSNVIINHVNTVKQFLDLYEGYQTSMETCWWQRVELWYGKNPEDEKDFTGFLKRIIRSEGCCDKLETS
jgi:hypothetical protein